MPALFVFLLKVNIALLLFCAGYYLILRPLTFYTLNRVYLLVAILFASVYPQINLSAFVQRHDGLASSVQHVAINWQGPVQSLIKPLSQPDYWHWAGIVFWLGVSILAVRLTMQLVSLYKLYKNSKPATINSHQVRVMDKDAAPFSFWKSIFINPAKHSPADLKAILLHEQVHVNEWHTADILLAELSSIFYWFNPGIWLMKKAIRENIEFITDRKILTKGIDSKTYQYSLVSVSFNHHKPSIVNHFNISTIKKRIIMMNAKRSSKFNLTRYAFLVPAVITVLLVFSISTADFARPIRLNLVAAIHPITNIIRINTDKKPVARQITIAKPKKTNKVVRALKADTVKKMLIIAGGAIKDTIVYKINGVKSIVKNADPAKITSIESATNAVKDTNIIRVYIKDSPKGKKIIDKTTNQKAIGIKSGNGSNSQHKNVAQSNAITVTGYRMKADNNITIVDRPNVVIVDTAISINSSPAISRKVVNVRVMPKVVVSNSTVAKISAATNASAENAVNINGVQINTTDGSDPLLIINGKEAPFSDLQKIDSRQIEDVNVSKGTEINKKYGDKGKNGVVFITTKNKK